MNRGYRLNRGKGQKRRGVKRGLCPRCGKRGMGVEHAAVILGRAALRRDCRYCAHTIRRYVGLDGGPAPRESAPGEKE